MTSERSEQQEPNPQTDLIDVGRHAGYGGFQGFLIGVLIGTVSGFLVAYFGGVDEPGCAYSCERLWNVSLGWQVFMVWTSVLTGVGSLIGAVKSVGLALLNSKTRTEKYEAQLEDPSSQ